jgi:hypothetical protein
MSDHCARAPAHKLKGSDMQQDDELQALVGKRVRIAKPGMTCEGVLKGRSFLSQIRNPASPPDRRWLLDTGAGDQHFAVDDGWIVTPV